MTTKNQMTLYDFGVKQTDLFYSDILSKMTYANVFIKREDQQENKSFKCRGAIHNMIAQTARHNDKVFACASTGNHAQGVAMACAKMKKNGIIFMPKNASKLKIEKTLNFGNNDGHQYVQVKLVGENFDECLKIAQQEVIEYNYCFIHPYDDELTIQGQGTLMEEVKRQLEKQNKQCDLIFSPVGGGGLISGIINTINKYKLPTKIIACQTELCHPLTKSLQEDKNIESDIENKEIITDGSLVKKIGDLTWDIINNKYKNHQLNVEVLTNEKVLYCMGLVKTNHNIDIEGAGGLSVAGFLQYAEKNDVKNKNVVLVNSGGNVSAEIQNKSIDFYKKNNVF